MPYKLKPLKGMKDSHIRFPEELAEKFIAEFTKPGGRVLDPFAGFGTTLFVAQRMGRIGIGVEYDKERYEYIRKRLLAPTGVIHGDSRKLGSYGIAVCDFSFTSPPYMQRHHPENPLTNYTRPGAYKRYLAEMRSVYAQVKKAMKPGAAVMLEVANITGDAGKPMTPLAWDIAAELSKIMFFEREFVFCHTGQAEESNTGQHSYCLLFRNH